jgi:uncharacterized membrane protein YGL010W
MPLRQLLATYEAAHRHPVNQATHAVGIPLIVASLVAWVWVPWWGALVMFVVGWIFQFIGHAAEGNSPKFFQGPIYLLVGPLWVALKVLSLVGLYAMPEAPPPAPDA